MGWNSAVDAGSAARSRNSEPSASLGQNTGSIWFCGKSHLRRNVKLESVEKGLANPHVFDEALDSYFGKIAGLYTLV
jgi:hypothetical protein